MTIASEFPSLAFAVGPAVPRIRWASPSPKLRARIYATLERSALPTWLKTAVRSYAERNDASGLDDLIEALERWMPAQGDNE